MVYNCPFCLRPLENSSVEGWYKCLKCNAEFSKLILPITDKERAAFLRYTEIDNNMSNLYPYLREIK
jgi:ribosomal protein L37AE/L43A